MIWLTHESLAPSRAHFLRNHIGLLIPVETWLMYIKVDPGRDQHACEKGLVEIDLEENFRVWMENMR